MLPKDFQSGGRSTTTSTGGARPGGAENRPGRIGRAPSEKRRAAPARIIDLQSAKTQCRSEERGIDGGKRVLGRKRHIGMGVLGNLLHTYAHTVNLHDTAETCEALCRAAGLSWHGSVLRGRTIGPGV